MPRTGKSSDQAIIVTTSTTRRPRPSAKSLPLLSRLRPLRPVNGAAICIRLSAAITTPIVRGKTAAILVIEKLAVTI